MKHTSIRQTAYRLQRIVTFTRYKGLLHESKKQDVGLNHSIFFLLIITSIGIK